MEGGWHNSIGIPTCKCLLARLEVGVSLDLLGPLFIDPAYIVQHLASLAERQLFRKPNNNLRSLSACKKKLVMLPSVILF